MRTGALVVHLRFGRQFAYGDPSDLNVTTYLYDELNRETRETNQLGAFRQYEYDAVGDVTKYTDRDGRVTEYGYDDLGRQTDEFWMDGNTTVRTFSYGYDAVGNLLSASDPNATYAYTPDALGRLTSQTQQITGLTPEIELDYHYNANSQQTQVAAKVGGTNDFVNDYTYDNTGRLTQLTQQGQGGNAVAEKRVDFGYNADSQFDTIARYKDMNGGSTNEVATSDYGYDAANRLTSLDYHKGTTTQSSYTFTYDAANNMTEMTSWADRLNTSSNAPAVTTYGVENTAAAP